MAEGDAAFLWETEALRASRRNPPEDAPTAPPDAGAPWLTLREAYYRTGIPIETLRKWARRSAIPSYLDDSPVGIRRMVRLDAVRKRAAELGRPLAPVERPASPPPPAPPVEPDPAPQAPAAPAPASPDDSLTEPEPGPEPDADPAPPPGTMIVPIEAWDKMLLQLGNLHEAGQQLAEARERAAKAETEATFLRERLGELRRNAPAEPAAPEPETVSSAREPGPTPVPPEPPVADQAVTEQAAPPEKLWRYIYRGWRSRRRG